MTNARMTVSLSLGSLEALERASELEGLSKTDTVNRALQMYRAIREEESSGSRVAFIRPGGELVEVRFL